MAAIRLERSKGKALGFVLDTGTLGDAFTDGNEGAGGGGGGGGKGRMIAGGGGGIAVKGAGGGIDKAEAGMNGGGGGGTGDCLVILMFSVSRDKSGRAAINEGAIPGPTSSV